ncbi:EamA family transporter RarD [Streptoalloteichus hindustanus]|uniref:Chloramphenicol-sensitive protein RarD n=1 Tax=Streptoalloteichus hindustanus TaxID=2017 RepID=A0A1M4TNV7_STRHI|nr:EamA family transporter RarD [Streptoalloteichus hindustanus]SHE46074.1 chloramphenicol-sensitive protein RarD [Streptoalloteichus hindustanus]
MPPLTNDPSPVAAPGRAAHGGDGLGLALGAGAYLLWGLFPAFWPLLRPAGPFEILGHRLAWTFMVMSMLVLATGRWRTLRALPSRGWLLVTAAAVLIAVNWATYIYGVNSGQVVETALGYFVNPLFSVLLGVVVLGERLRGAQWVALAVAGGAVVVLTVDYGRVPLIALTLAVTFGIYGLIKKTVPLDSASSLAAESAVLGPLAAAYVLWLEWTGAGTFAGGGVGHALLLVLTGPITAVPLVLFGAAARRVPLVTIGILQYLAPILQFAWGVLVVREDMPASRWLGFGLVWVALAIFTVDAVRAARRARTGAGATG